MTEKMDLINMVAFKKFAHLEFLYLVIILTLVPKVVLQGNNTSNHVTTDTKYIPKTQTDVQQHSAGDENKKKVLDEKFAREQNQGETKHIGIFEQSQTLIKRSITLAFTSSRFDTTLRSGHQKVPSPSSVTPAEDLINRTSRLFNKLESSSVVSKTTKTQGLLIKSSIASNKLLELETKRLLTSFRDNYSSSRNILFSNIKEESLLIPTVTLSKSRSTLTATHAAKATVSTDPPLWTNAVRPVSTELYNLDKKSRIFGDNSAKMTTVEISNSVDTVKSSTFSASRRIEVFEDYSSHVKHLSNEMTNFLTGKPASSFSRGHHTLSSTPRGFLPSAVAPSWSQMPTAKASSLLLPSLNEVLVLNSVHSIHALLPLPLKTSFVEPNVVSTQERLQLSKSVRGAYVSVATSKWRAVSDLRVQHSGTKLLTTEQLTNNLSSTTQMNVFAPSSLKNAMLRSKHNKFKVPGSSITTSSPLNLASPRWSVWESPAVPSPSVQIGKSPAKDNNSSRSAKMGPTNVLAYSSYVKSRALEYTVSSTQLKYIEATKNSVIPLSISSINSLTNRTEFDKTESAAASESTYTSMNQTVLKSTTLKGHRPLFTTPLSLSAATRVITGYTTQTSALQNTKLYASKLVSSQSVVTEHENETVSSAPVLISVINTANVSSLAAAVAPFTERQTFEPKVWSSRKSLGTQATIMASQSTMRIDEMSNMSTTSWAFSPKLSKTRQQYSSVVKRVHPSSTFISSVYGSFMSIPISEANGSRIWNPLASAKVKTVTISSVDQPRSSSVATITAMISTVTSKPTTKKPLKTTTEQLTQKPPIPSLPSMLIRRSKTTIVVQLDLKLFNLRKALKIDVVIQRYGPKTVDFDGITALPPVTWFKVHYMVRYAYRRYIAASSCVGQFNCNKGFKPFGYDHHTRSRRQVRNGLLIFSAGDEKGCQNRQGETDYCNGPLEPDTTYRFQILIHYRDSSHISTTPFSKPIITAASVDVTPTSEPDHSSGLTTLIVVIIVVLIVLLLVVLMLVTFAKRKQNRHRPYGRDGELRCALISSIRTYSTCSCATPTNVEQGFLMRPLSKGMSRPVSVKDFGAWVARSSADSDFRFAEEFESIRDVGRDQLHEASDMPENRGKNRYVNVLAYDHTRVKLSYTDDEAGSDYINGNYIHGYKQPRAYIATQGPLPGTTDDFWRMVWEQNSYVVVMITQLTERSRVKCHKYWPGTEPTTYGEIAVTLMSEYAFPNWCEREFLLEVEDEEPRRIHHFQYTSWPDHGVPKTTSDILEFQSSVQSHCLSTHGPIIVHCSAGVGRTGTFIAIDTIIKKLQEEAVIDIYGTVCLMRLQRCSMVQTEDQYIYIHRALLEYIKQREMNTHIFKGYSLLPLEERDLLDSDRGSEDASLAPTSPLLSSEAPEVAVEPNLDENLQKESVAL